MKKYIPPGKHERYRYVSNSTQIMHVPTLPQTLEPQDDGDLPKESQRDIKSRETYKEELAYLYKNKQNLNPKLYRTLKYTVFSSFKLNHEVPDIESKKIIFRSLFKNCYSNIDDTDFKKNLSIYHNHISYLRKNVYPYTFMGKTSFENPFLAL